ncbi:MAG: type II toxin-antitoxin system mRNA interferase toxin, RelE/StbE family [Betaproteobacteria bacterium HGW-Betaproteobacteria-22]|nr:MAG: type II toxin-antitoxin system mRNA interferase toxin, RelE/StbE family [Betaproteobacteria bacterium HGW-Betaproteobacteria-22]
MRTIEKTGQFKRDFKRESKGKHRKTLAEDLLGVLELLIADVELPAKYFDHSMIGSWNDHRNCHIKPDLVLLYRLPDNETLQLVRIGSHSELGI